MVRQPQRAHELPADQPTSGNASQGCAQVLRRRRSVDRQKPLGLAGEYPVKQRGELTDLRALLGEVNMREGFKEIVDGWALISGVEDITERIERAAEWTKANGPLEPDEEATVKLMIECQIARGMDDW